MKLLLAIETSHRLASVAIAGPDGLIAECAEEDGGRTENVQRMTAGLFRENGRSPREIDGIAVSVGPGSFTGTRIGLAVAKGIALANGCPLAGVTVPHALACEADPDRVFEVWLDVGRGEVYRTLVRGDETLEAGFATPVEELLSMDRVSSDAPPLIGRGADRYRKEIAERWPGCIVMKGEANDSRARTIARIGWNRIIAGEGHDWQALEPAYARAADAKLPRNLTPKPQSRKGAR